MVNKYHILVVILDKMSQPQPHTQTKKDTYVIDLLLEAMRSIPHIFFQEL